MVVETLGVANGTVTYDLDDVSHLLDHHIEVAADRFPLRLQFGPAVVAFCLDLSAKAVALRLHLTSKNNRLRLHLTSNTIRLRLHLPSQATRSRLPLHSNADRFPLRLIA